MGKILIIAEKPSVARDIAVALGVSTRTEWGYENTSVMVAAARGHLVELFVPEAETTGKSLETLPVLPSRFMLRATASGGSQYKVLSSLMARRDVDCVVNACDAGREGELIFRLIYELAGCSRPMRRMWLQSMTMDAIVLAYKNMKDGSEYAALGDAARCRAEADWIVGINGTRGITRLKEVQTGHYETQNAGRVQTPTLTIPVRREQEIRAFVPKDYFEVHGRFQAQAGGYAGRWLRERTETSELVAEDVDPGIAFRLNSRAEADSIVAKCSGQEPSRVTDECKPINTVAPRLFDLTTLQREANARFKFPAKKTLDVAQALYERHKATTYPRTDASALPEDYLENVRTILGSFSRTPFDAHAQRVLGNHWLRQDKRIFDNAKISDHFAIIPTGTLPQGLTADESKIFDLITRRFLAAFHPASEHRQTTRTTVVVGESFMSRGRVLVSKGWLEVYGEAITAENEEALCLVNDAEFIRTLEVVSKGLKTQAPKRYTEGTLLAAMEGAGKLVDDDALRNAMSKNGLGTPATRANTIEGLLADVDGAKRPKEPYLLRLEDATLQPTDKAMNLIAFLDGNGLDSLTSPKMTGEWEKKLRLMELGEYRRVDFMGEIKQLTTHMLAVLKQRAGEAPAVASEPLRVACPRCGSSMQATPRTFECVDKCGFNLRREVAKRNLSNDEAVALLRDGAIKQLDGFHSTAKKKDYSAGLKLNVVDARVELVFDDHDRTDLPLSPPLSAPCPKCKGNLHFRGGDHPRFACAKCDFKLWAVIAGRILSDQEAAELVRSKKLAPVHGFISSRTGKPFGAGLKFNRDLSKVEFVMEGRA